MSEAYKLYHAAMTVQTKEEADVYVQMLINAALEEKPELNAAEAKAITLHNIGYWTGYLNEEVARRVLQLYDTEHPIFGKYEHDITPGKAFKAGMILAELGATPEGMQAAREIMKQP